MPHEIWREENNFLTRQIMWTQAQEEKVLELKSRVVSPCLHGRPLAHDEAPYFWTGRTPAAPETRDTPCMGNDSCRNWCPANMKTKYNSFRTAVSILAFQAIYFRTIIFGFPPHTHSKRKYSIVNPLLRSSQYLKTLSQREF